MENVLQFRCPLGFRLTPSDTQRLGYIKHLNGIIKLNPYMSGFGGLNFGLASKTVFVGRGCRDADTNDDIVWKQWPVAPLSASVLKCDGGSVHAFYIIFRANSTSECETNGLRLRPAFVPIMHLSPSTSQLVLHFPWQLIICIIRVEKTSINCAPFGLHN